jgi:hypothetical protein
MRMRVLIGSVVLVLGLTVYALLAMRLAVAVLPESTPVQVVFYAAAGLAWVWPAARLTRWMQQEN